MAKPIAFPASGARQHPPKDPAGPLERLLRPESIDSLCFGAMLERGAQYASEGKVLELRLTARTLTALVGGGGEMPYTVRLSSDAKGSTLAITSCTCPFHDSELGSQTLCKHQVAAAIVGLRQYGIDRELRAIARECPAKPEPIRPRRSRI